MSVGGAEHCSSGASGADNYEGLGAEEVWQLGEPLAAGEARKVERWDASDVVNNRLSRLVGVACSASVNAAQLVVVGMHGLAVATGIAHPRLAALGSIHCTAGLM